MTLAVVLSLVAAALVELTRSVTLASVFPWRVSVVLVPLAFVIVATTGAGVLVRVLDRRAVLGFVAALGVFAVWTGAHVSRESRAEAPSPAVELLRATSPDGVGLIPLGYENVRLNARLPVYVDWKTHPYDRAELAEWVRRVESVRAIRSDPTRLCDLVEREAIDWVVVGEGWNVACLERWRRIERDGVRLLIRPS
jgi:hypothetical protein